MLDQPPLLCSCETLPALLGLPLEPSKQEANETVRAGPEEATKMIKGLIYVSEDTLRE